MQLDKFAIATVGVADWLFVVKAADRLIEVVPKIVGSKVATVRQFAKVVRQVARQVVRQMARVQAATTNCLKVNS